VAEAPLVYPGRSERERVAQVAAPARQSRDLDVGQEIDRSLVVIGALSGGSGYEGFRAWGKELFCQVVVKVTRPHWMWESLGTEELYAWPKGLRVRFSK
jgi:hypothetical protein